METPSTMQAVFLTGHGGFENLVFTEDAPVPTPKPDEVLIRVGAAGVNNTDINTRIGWYSKSVSDATTAEGSEEGLDQARAEDSGWNGSLEFPRIQGADACGKIIGVGKNVCSSRIGERVIVEPCLHTEMAGFSYFGSECNGGFAQFTTAPTEFTHRVECEWSDAELASIPCSYSTAENLLTRAMLKEGETILITGASGGVGSAAVQLAKRRGAQVIAIASHAKASDVKDLGAKSVIDREANLVQELGENSIDVVIDLVAGPQWQSFLSVLKPRGRYAVAGAIAGPIVELDVRTLYLKDLSFFGCTRLEPQVFNNLVGYIENDEIKPVLANTYPLREIVQAQKDFLEKSHTGKLVLIP